MTDKPYTDAEVQTCIDWLYSAMHDDRQIPEMAENLLEDLVPTIAARTLREAAERMTRADSTLRANGFEGTPDEIPRLIAKAEGVRLARSYVEETIRAIEKEKSSKPPAEPGPICGSTTLHERHWAIVDGRPECCEGWGERAPDGYRTVVTRYGGYRHYGRRYAHTLIREADRHVTLCRGTTAWTIREWERLRDHPLLTIPQMEALPVCDACLEMVQ